MSGKLPIYMHARDDVARGNFSVGCCLEKTSKEAEQSTQPEFTKIDVSSEYKQDYFAKRVKLEFTCHYVKFVPVEAWLNTKNTVLKRAPLDAEWEPMLKSIDSSEFLKGLLKRNQNLGEGESRETPAELKNTEKERKDRDWEVRTSHLRK